MIPKIEKLELKDLSLSCGAKKEVTSILRNKKNILGYKFRVRGEKCVAVGRFSGNDFDIFRFTANIQTLMEKRGHTIPEKFRFVFLSAA